MTTTDDLAARLAKLAEPFPPEEVGLLPRITCKRCSDSPGKACNDHARRECRDCHQFMTPKHIHIDYVGHADVTRRLLDVDPGWTWEPVADAGALGFPVVQGGMWIKLTICGVSRYGFGDAQGKTGPNAVKELIGDALRNAAMRFGVGLNLWAKGDRDWSRQGGAAADAEHIASGSKPLDRPAPQTSPPVDADPWASADPKIAAQADGFAELIEQAKVKEDARAIWDDAKAAGVLGIALGPDRDHVKLAEYLTAVASRLPAEQVSA